MKQVIKRNGNKGTVIGKQKHIHLKLTAGAMAMLMLIGFLKKLINDSRIVSVNDITDSKKVLMHLSWMRLGIFSCLIFVALTCALVGMGFEADSTLRLVLSWACVLLYIVAYSTVFLKNRMNSFLLRYVY